ncbi:MAG TPA: acetyl-coenzyme A synthetase N-terminal domain-containing protein, partial [Candidatus Polarisedimenticolia bacterium]|nr:acetyl-coenzyme A synthetase N-terminal domain-containing protein [Candidatus Polarisedimenticolia bacterium]
MKKKARKSTPPKPAIGIDVLLHERRVFKPPQAFRKQANVSDAGIYRKAARNPEAFWAARAKELTWFRP